MIQRAGGGDEKLPFPTRPLKVHCGSGTEYVEEYIIPDDQKQEVLEKLFIFTPVPSLDDEMYDIHEGKTFRVREFRVTWENGHNWLVSPYYPLTGGTVIDWIPADEWNEDESEEEEEEEEDQE